MSGRPVEGGERISARAAARALTLLWSAAPVWCAGYAGLSLLAGALVPVNAWLFAQVVDRVVARDGDAVGLVLALGASAAALAVVAPATRYVQAEVTRRLGWRAKGGLMRAVNGITGLELLERPAFLDRLRLAEQAGMGAPQVLAQSVFGAAQATVTAAGLALVLAAVSPWLAVLTVVSCLPAAFAAVAESRDRARMMWQTTPGLRRESFYAGLMTDPRSAKEIRVFGLGELLHHRMMADLREVAGAQRGVDRRAALAQGGLALAGAVLAAGVVVWGVRQAVAGAITVGDVSILLTGVGGLQASAATIVHAFGDAHHSVLIFGHYDVVLELSAVAVARPQALPTAPARTAAGIEFRDVSFAYGDGRSPALSGVTFAIPDGAMVALVGANGAGKSTVVKLLCRLYEPTAGAITWDGEDIAGLDATEVRGRIGVLFQDFMRYDLTAADNVGFGRVDRLADRQALQHAAELAGIDGVIDGLPHGYDTMLSRAFGGPEDEEGVQLSGGQWQRVALARSLMRSDAKLMILDEPSSGLDAEAEAALYEHLRTSRNGRACLLVTHRLSAVRDADLIVVLSGGEVVEQGAHAGLLAAGGEYARLFRLQAGGYGRLADVAIG